MGFSENTKRFRYLLKKIAGSFMGLKPASDFFRALRQNSLTILYYHRIVDEKSLDNVHLFNMFVGIRQFDKQMALLSRLYVPVSERDILIAAEAGRRLPDNAVWVTFDDGYRDNIQYAAPILKKYGIPATFFLTTGFLDGSTIPTEDYVSYAVLKSKFNKISLSFSGKEMTFSLESPEQRTMSIHKLISFIRKSGLYVNNILEHLVSSLKIDPREIPHLFMSWDEAKSLRDYGFFSGAHTVTHQILSTLSDSQMEYEIVHSKEKIEKMLDQPVLSFAFPRGRKIDYSFHKAFPVLKKCGIRLAVSTIGGTNRHFSERHLLNLKRIGVSYEDTLDFFRFKVVTGSFWQGL